jgi:hypothetical protein
MKKECEHKNIEPCGKDCKWSKTMYYCRDCKRMLGYKFLEKRVDDSKHLTNEENK